ncbi:hypothetical protein BRC92_04340 [Halobacteriales archaeon QS_4_69_31]|nr:MAG: hypothetical protein BRC92_04340 [Halobacteriales archaeon QS_4_69_31]
MRPTARGWVLAALVLAVSLSVVGATSGAGAAAGPDRPDGSGFASDAAAHQTLDQPRTRVEVTRTRAGGHAAATDVDTVLASAPRSIAMTQRLALTPEARGQVRVTYAFDLPEGVTRLETQVPPEGTAVKTEGFDRTGEGYEWDGETGRPTLSYSVPANETIQQPGPEGFEGQYLFVDAGAWALVQRPQIPVQWAWQGDTPVGLSREATVAGPGYAGDSVAYLGETTVRSWTAHGQTVRLVVPERARLAESPDAVFAALADAADRLRVGDRDEVVTVFAAPTTTVEWGVRGLQVGDTDMWVRDAEPVDAVDSTWFHEYVHARQGYEPAPSARWLDEATATYYSALLALETGRATFDDFRAFLRRGGFDPQSGAVLARPSTWASAANYWKGALVTAAVDRRVRLATGGTRSFGTVLSRLNEADGPVDNKRVLAAVAGAAGSEAATFAREYTTTTAVPETWTRGQHAEAFGETPARFTYRFGDADGNADVTVSGPYRNGSVDDGSLTLYAGETLTATASITNAGGADASYEQQFTVGETVRETVSGTLAPGETATHTVSHTFTAAGRFPLTFGTDTIEVAVHEPATATIANSTVNRTSLDRPGRVGVTVTVTNEFDAPARRQVNVTRDGERVATRVVTLRAGETWTTTIPVSLPSTGDHRLAVEGSEPLTVTVGSGGGENGDATESNTGGGNDGDGPSAVGPGFGPAVTLSALLALVVVCVLRGRRR